jgi:hypothetical protein
MILLFWLLVGHAIADYPLQGDFLARGKNQTAPFPGIPWYQCLFWHSLMHGGMVTLITGSIFLGLFETIAHASIDYAKCAGKLSFNQDQFLHVICKIIWVILFLFNRVIY